ncbi:MAG: porin family protein [Xanthobacteraceae bacterium]|jgi:outer membrane immunogenic protein|nr:porin family protein [Xanthobacteraceae bacterium]
MKKFAVIGAVIAALSFAAPVQAADAPIVYKAPQAFNWNGFYVGAHIGYGWGDASGLNLDGFVGGAQIGFNAHLSSNIVIGLETDISATNIGAGAVDQPWIWSGRARLGYAMDRTLIYGTVGVAATRLDGGAGGTAGFIGAVYGAGVEWAWTRNWTMRVEYLHYDFGDEILPLFAAPVNLNTDVVRFGVNYRF